MISFTERLNEIYSMNLNEIDKSFTFLGSGCCRAVYAIDKSHVIKVAYCLDGYDQCGLENRIYRHVDKNLRRYLCPILWYRPGMIVMPRATPLSYLIKDDIVDLRKLGRGSTVPRDMKRLAKKYNLLYEDIVSPTSWGAINGQLYLIDYGCTN